MSDPFEIRAKIAKVDETLGLVMGWAIVCTEEGEPYYDSQGDHIPESSMLEAATEFAKTSRESREQHLRSDAGTVLFSFPLTQDVAKAFGIGTQTTGLMIAIQPDAEMLAKFRSGELTGFSIGGRRIKDEDVAA